jgi:RHS repeat-associated protein
VNEPGGAQVKKIVDNTAESSVTSTEYAGNYIYEDGNLQFFNTAEGYIKPVISTSGEISSFDYIYQYKDHLGKIRLSYSDRDDNGSIVQAEIREENNYYPFGLQHRGYNNVVNGTENNYQTYQGQEEEKELGKNTYAFQWRDYDPAIARFNKIDRFAEKYENTTPYHFSANNPIFFREIKGDSINVAELYKKDEDGNYVNASQVKAFEAFAGTKAGEKYLSQFASKGQKIAGIEFDKDGKYHKDKMDINFGATPTDKSADGTTGLVKDDNGRWQFDVNFRAGSNDTYENVGALSHELFVHVDNYIPDIYDDGQKNYSNMPNWINERYSPRQRHH